MKSLNSKTDISIFINFRYFWLKMLKNKQNNKKLCHIFHHNFKNIPCYAMSEVSLKRFYFALFDDGLTLKTLKMAFIGFLIQTLQVFNANIPIWAVWITVVLQNKYHRVWCKFWLMDQFIRWWCKSRGQNIFLKVLKFKSIHFFICCVFCQKERH